MRAYLKATVVLSIVALAGASAWAQAPYYARGEFNGWGITGAGNPLTETPVGSGHYQGTVTLAGGLNAPYYEYKLANGSWSQNWPANNGRVMADATGLATFHLWLTHPDDGWFPTGVRVGYDDLGWSWEVIGDFDGWTNALVSLTPQGNGLHSATVSIPTAGTHQFKFRKTSSPPDWAISIGADFGNTGGNLSVGTTFDGQLVQFDLDLPNGRLRARPVGSGISFDGVLDFGPGQEWADSVSAVQNNYTGFGDQKVGPVLSGGSELDGLYVQADSTYLYVGITGNLETNGNAIVVFIDTKAGGQTTLAGLTALGGSAAFEAMQGDTLNATFAPGYALVINTGAKPCDGSQRCDVDWYTLPAGGASTHAWRGYVPLNSGSAALQGGDNANSLQLAFDDTNVAGVTNADATNPGSAMTGIEASIPLADLGGISLPATIGLQVLLVGNGGVLSNQSLPSMPFGTANLNGPPVNLDTAITPTVQLYTDVTLTNQTWSGTLDGRNIAVDFSAPNYQTLQQNWTGFGEQVWTSGTLPGSEIDQMLVKKDDSGNLLIGITGDLQAGAPDGPNLVIFLDTKAGGETTLTDHGDKLTGNAGMVLPCAMDYAILLNRNGGNVYVDLYDLSLDALTSKTYMGSIPEAALWGGPLTGGSAVNWLMGVNMGNTDAGVNDNPLNDPQPANALTATKGFELSVPLAQIGVPGPGIPAGTKIHLLPMLTGACGDRLVSNQLLPPLGGGQPNFSGGAPDLSGRQCLELPLTNCHAVPFDADGDGDVDMDDYGAFQACYGLAATGDCACFDGNGDGLVNGADFGDPANPQPRTFVGCASGPGVDASTACMQ